MDKDKEDALKRVFKRILTKLVKEVQKGGSDAVDAIMINQTTYELLKEVTIRTN